MNDSPERVAAASADEGGGAAKFSALFDQPAVGIAEAGVDGRFIRVNERFGEIVGRDPESLAGVHIRDITHAQDSTENLERFRRLAENGEPFIMEKRYVRPDGSAAWVELYGSPVRAADGSICSGIAVALDITERKQAENLRIAQNRVLELAVQDEPLEKTLEALVLAVEEQASTDVIGSILLLDADGRHLRHGAAPGLPQAYNDAIDGLEIGPQVGSCGTAAHFCEPVFVEDIGNDSRWADFRELALSSGLRACWSIPIMSSAGEVLGTFAMYHRQPRSPAPRDLELVEFVTRSAALVIERNRSEQALRESEARFREVANAAPVLIWLADTENKGIWYNKAWLDFTGRTMEQELGFGWIDNVHPDDRARCADICGGAFKRRQPFRFDFRLRHADGAWRIIDDSGVPRFAGDGTFLGYIGSCIDVTDARATEQALREAEERYRLAARATNDAIWDWDLQRNYVLWNDALYTVYGYDKDDVEPTGEWWLERIHPDDRERVNTSIHAVIDGSEENWMDEYRFRRADGSYAFVYDRGTVIRDSSGRTLRMIGALLDQTGIRAAERALRESEERYRLIVEGAEEFAIVTLDEHGIIASWNTGAERLIGYTEDEAIGRPGSIFFTDEEREDGAPEHEMNRAETDGRAINERWHQRKDGSRFWGSGLMMRLEPEGSGYLKIFRDRTLEYEGERALADQGRILETLNRTGTAVAGELDLQKVVQLVTDAGVELTGAEFGAFFYNVLDDQGESYMLFTLSGAKPEQFNFGMPRNTKVFAPTFEGTGVVRSDDITRDPRYGHNAPHNGMPKGHLPVRSYLAVPVVSRSGEVLGGLFFGHPETGRFDQSHERLMMGIAAQAAVAIDNARLYQAVQRAKETLEQRVEERTAELETANEALRQAQKMEAIGQLTGGIAHDFNNMLTVIRGSADVLRRPDLDDARRDRYLQAIADTADRAARLTGQLLAFARRQALKPEVFDAAKRVVSISEMMRTVLGSRIRLVIEAECDDCFVETDAAQFETALVNMAVNGRDAMDDEGELRISIERPKALPPALRNEDCGYVAVSVADTGHGISADDLDKIFEPFFTTKETGKGTGLGLSQVYGFAKQSGGEIEVDSKPGEGTRFTLYLPHEPDARGQDEPRAVQPQALATGGRVLVVEDNDEVGLFAEQVLGELGFEARLAGSGDEALQILEDGEAFDVVFSDVVMPGIGGIDLARRIRARWPELPVVLTSGYSHILAARAEHAFPLLHKPYSLEALAKVLGKALAPRDEAETAED